MSKKIILRQSVKSGVAVVFFFGLGMASINAQTTQTTQPTGKVGINTTTPTETLDVKGKVRIQELYTDGTQTGTNNNATFTATNVVTADDNGVLGKRTLSSIIAAQTPNLPWKKVKTTENAVPVDGLSMYSKYAVGIGDYSNASSSTSATLEVLDGLEDQFALRRGNYRWNFNAYTVNNNPFLTIVVRPNNKKLLTLSSLGALYLGSGMTDSAGSGANLILDGGTGTIGVGKNSTDYDLDVNGYTRISQLPTSNDYAKYYTTENGTRVQKTKTDKYVPAQMVVVDADGVLGKQAFPTIPTIPTIPTEPWRQLGGTDEATTNTQNIYQNGKVGIGNYASTSTFDSDFEVNSIRNGYHIGIANGADIKWNLSAENDGEKSFTLTRRHKDLSQGRLLSITKDAKLYLGNTLTTPGGGNTKITLDGKDGNIILIDKWRVGLKGNSLMFYNSSTTGDSNNKFTLTNEGKLFLGKDLNGDGNGTGANILLDGKEGKVAIGKNSADYNLDVAGNAGIKGRLNLIDSSDDNNKFLTYTEGTQLLFDKKIAVPILHTTQTGVMASLTNVGKLYLGNNLTKPDGETLYTKNAKILLDGENGTVGIGKNYTDYDLDVNGYTRISQLPTSNDYAKYYTTENGTRVQKTKTEKYAPKKMVVVDDNGVLGKADIPTGGGSGNGVTKHTGNSTPQCNAANAGTIHYKEEVTVNGKPTSVMGFCMKTATKQYRWFYIFGGAGTTTGSEAATPNFGDGL